MKVIKYQDYIKEELKTINSKDLETWNNKPLVGLRERLISKCSRKSEDKQKKEIMKEAITKRQIDVLKDLIKLDGYSIDIHVDYNSSLVYPTYVAVYNSDPELLDFFLDNELDINKVATPDPYSRNRTIFYYINNVDMMWYILEKGADPNIKDEMDENFFNYQKSINIKSELETYEFQKFFLEKYPEHFDEIKKIGFNDQIKVEFKHLVNASNIDLL